VDNRCQMPIVCCDNIDVCVFWVKMEEVINSVWFQTSYKTYLFIRVSHESWSRSIDAYSNNAYFTQKDQALARTWTWNFPREIPLSFLKYKFLCLFS